MIREYYGGEGSGYQVDPKTSSFHNVVHCFAQASANTQAKDLSYGRNTWARFKTSLGKKLQNMFLPVGYPASVTDDLLPSAKLELVQQVCSSIPGTLSTRAVLMGIGVGAATANASSSTITWVMRDGVRLIVSVFFATRVSTNLDMRSKTWRMIADISNDFAALVEVVGSWFPPLFLWSLAFAASLKAVVSVCSLGSRTSFSEHFAKIGNLADVNTKASNREYVAAFIGLFLGSLTMYLTPEDSVFFTMTMFLFFTFLHLLVNYFSLRAHIMDHLNAPRYEVCMKAFIKSAEEERKHADPASKEPIRVSACTLTTANHSEYLFILPPRPLFRKTLTDRLLAPLYCLFPALDLRIRFGVSIRDAFETPYPMKTLPVTPIHIHKISEALSCKGVALLYNTVSRTYYVLYAEYFTKNGQPASWEPFRRQDALLKLARQGVEDPEEEFMKTEKENHVIINRGHHSMMVKQLWAFFYAYYHYHSLGGGSASSPKSNLEKGSSGEDVYVIHSLRDDGVFVPEEQTLSLFSFDDRTPYDVLEELRTKDYKGDSLYNLFITFFLSLKRQSYRLDRVLLPNEGFTVQIEYT